MNPFRVEEIATETHVCPIHGEYETKKIRLSSLSQTFVVMGCPKCEEEREARNNVVDTRELYKSYSIPERFLDATLDNFETRELDSLIRAKTICQRYAKSQTSGRNLLLTGQSFTGKTHLATALLKLLPGNNKLYTNIIDIMNEIKSTYSKSRGYLEERRDSIIKRYTWIEYLVIDNLEELGQTQDTKKILFELINGRYNNNRCTIVCAQMDQNKLREFLSDSLFRRVKERGAVIELEEKYAR